MKVYELVVAFYEQSQKAGWSKEKVDNVFRDAKHKGPRHLKKVLIQALSEIGSAVPSR